MLSHPRQVPSHAVERPALRRQLDHSLENSPLSLVVAPAGAGKTVLLTQWAATRADVAVAWFDITAADEAAGAFARRLVEEISVVAPAFQPPSAPVAASDQGLGEHFIEELAGSLADLDAKVALVFDDLDRLAGTALLADLWRLIDLLPPNAHAVFCSRVDLKLGWSRHRLQHGLVEIRQGQLAFDVDTTTKVLESITGWTIDDDLATAVTARTEGWAVGVQLSALGLRSAANPPQLVNELADTDRLVVDYLSEEVLDAMEPERRHALTTLAVLDELSPGLVTAIAHTPGVEFLDRLERDSLFLVRVAERPGWFRLHRLFRDLLLYRLRAGDDHAEARILEAAADWHIGERDLDTAVGYLLRAGCWDRALDAILHSGRDLYEDMPAATVARWLSLIPADVRATRTDGQLLLAIAQRLAGNSAPAGNGFQTVLANKSLRLGERQVALAYLAAGVQFEARPEVFLDASRRALDALEQHPDAEPPELMGLTSRTSLSVVSHVSLGRALILLGRLGEARNELLTVHESSPASYTQYRVHTLGSLALAEALSGRLVAASEHADEALETAREFGLLAQTAPADAYLARAFIAIQRGEPEAASVSLGESRVRAAVNHRTQLLWITHFAARLIDPDDSAALPTPSGPPPHLVRQSLAALNLRRSRLRGAPRAAPTTSPEWTALSFEEVAALIAGGDLNGARSRLALLDENVTARTPLRSVELEILHAWLCVEEGHRVHAGEHFRAALSFGEPEHLVDPFLRAGSSVFELLDETPGRRPEFGQLVAERLRATAPPRAEKLFDELTPRELELLMYLPSRLTIADIAARLFVSTNTVKTHFSHVYRKLGVTSRDEAIERAVLAGLLDSREMSRAG